MKDDEPMNNINNLQAKYPDVRKSSEMALCEVYAQNISPFIFDGRDSKSILVSLNAFVGR